MAIQGAGVFDGIVDFNSGYMIGVPNSGDLNTNPTPRQFGVLQEASVEFSADIVELHGQFKYPVDTATAKNKVPIKAKWAAMDGRVLSDLWMGTDPVAGMQIFLLGTFAEAAAIPGMTTYTITVAQASPGPIVDYGVTFTDGTALTKIPTGGSLTATGQYMVVLSTGIYTFHSSDASKNVLINYSYPSSSRGTTVKIQNQLMGSGPRFSLLLFNEYKNKQMAILLQQCIMGKFSVPRKQGAYAMSDFESSAFADSNGLVATVYQDTHD